MLKVAGAVHDSDIEEAEATLRKQQTQQNGVTKMKKIHVYLDALTIYQRVAGFVVIAVKLARPDKRFMRVFTGGSTSGLIASTILPVVVLVPYCADGSALPGYTRGYTT